MSRSASPVARAGWICGAATPSFLRYATMPGLFAREQRLLVDGLVVRLVELAVGVVDEALARRVRIAEEAAEVRRRDVAVREERCRVRGALVRQEQRAAE